VRIERENPKNGREITKGKSFIGMEIRSERRLNKREGEEEKESERRPRVWLAGLRKSQICRYARGSPYLLLQRIYIGERGCTGF
jgi:hypothetical protein